MLGLGWILLVHVDEGELVPWTRRLSSLNATCSARVARHGHLMTSTPLQLQAVGCSSRAIAVSHLPPSNLGEASQEQSRIPAFPRPVTKLEKKSRNCCGMRCSAANQ